MPLFPTETHQMKRNLLPFVVAAALLPAASLFAEIPDWSGYSKSVKITFPGHAGSQELQNFPVLVRVSAANGFDYAKFKLSGGGDLRFAGADGNLLAHEIDTWNDGGESLVWVKVPLLTSDTEIVAHYGNASPVAAPAASDVWSEGYAGVWHMNATADETTQADSTANGLDAIVPAAIADGVEAGVAGTVGTAAAFDKRTDHNGGYAVPDTSNLLHGQEAMTWEVWAKQASYAAYNAYFFRMYPYAAGESDAYKIYEWKETGLPVAYPRVAKSDGTTPEQTYWPTGKIPPLNQWNHLVWRYDGKAGTKAVILNGNTSGKYSGAADKGTILTLSNGGGVTVGNFTVQDSANAFPGSLDEIRISSVTRSDAWIAATYATIADETFASYEAIASGGNDWNKYARKFSVSFPGVPQGAVLTNFPVLVKLSASSPSGFRYADCAKANGADLRFADENGNALDSEVEAWNPDGESLVWVKVPTLTSSTKITGYYGWAEAPAADDSAVWSDGFLAVWHLDGASDSTTQSDSTPARRSLALLDAAGVRPGVDGVAGKAAMFNVSDNHKGVYSYDNSDGALAGLTNMTVEVWTKTTGAPSYNGYLFFCERDGATAYMVYQKKDTAKLTCDYYYDKDGTATYFWGDSTEIDENDWDHVAFRYDGSNGRTSVVLNGVAKTPKTPGCYGLMAGTGKFFLGNRANSWASNAFPGSIDEVRISNVARSDAWLAATRATIADNAAFTTYGAASDNIHGTVLFFR